MSSEEYYVQKRMRSVITTTFLGFGGVCLLMAILIPLLFSPELVANATPVFLSGAGVNIVAAAILFRLFTPGKPKQA
jgi:hypothetical protein